MKSTKDTKGMSGGLARFGIFVLFVSFVV